MIIAKQSTARTVMVGPVLDASGVAVTDGVVADFEGSVNGGDPAALNGSATLTHRGVGFYSLALTATDLATVGSFQVTINDTVNACPMKDITVIEEAVYDAFFGASAPGYVAAAHGILDEGTAQAATATTLQLRSAVTFADDELNGATIVITGGSTGVGQRAIITDYVGSTDTATVPTWTTTPTGTITYKIFASAAGMQAADIATSVWASGTRTLTAGTNIALAKGTGVTGFNDLSAAQVNAEVDTALTDIHLDHLLAADYDPASKPGVSTALFNELIESDGGVSRYTTNALEQGPAGGGGGGLDAAGVRAAVGLASANLDTQLGALPTAAENAAEVLSAASSNPIDANIEEVNNIQLQGVGTSGNPWRPA